jgi:hypothetical protein
MTREYLTHPVAAAVTTQDKLCPYDKEELHIWFRFIEAQFCSDRDHITKIQICQFSSQPAQASPSGHSRHIKCLQ